MYKPSPSHQLILDTLTEKNREGFAIGGGAFYGKNLGTREGFSSYKKNLVTENFFKYSSAGGGSSFEDLTPEQKKLFKKGKLYYVRMEDPSRPRTATKKPMRTIFGDSDKIDIIVGNKVPTDLKNLPEELSNRGKTAKKIREKFIIDYLSGLEKGQKINLDATTRIIGEQLSEATGGKITMTDKKLLLDILDNKKLNKNKIKRPGSVKEAKDIYFKDYDVSESLIERKAEELNKKYKLEDKGIKFKLDKTSTGKNVIQLYIGAKPFQTKTSKGTAEKINQPFTDEGVAKLEERLKNIMKSKEFKTYSAKEASRQGSIRAGKKKLGFNQPELFEYLLKQEGPISREQVLKDFKEFGYDEGTLKKAISNLHANMYRALDPLLKNRATFLRENYDSKEIRNVLDKVKNNFPGDFFKRTFESLLIDAYGQMPKKYKPLAEKLKKFRELQSELRKAGVDEKLIAQLDHVIPYNFLQLVREGKDPSELLRVKAYPGYLNSTRFKGAIDKALGQATEVYNKTGDRTRLDLINELRSFLPEDMGEIEGKKIKDYGAEKFNLKTSLSKQQEEFGKVYQRTQDFLENKKVKDLLKDAGITLRGIRQLKQLNIPGFINTLNKLLEKRPDLRVEFENYFSPEERTMLASLDNQTSGTMTDVYTGPKIEKSDESSLPYEVGLPTAMVFGKYAPSVLKMLGTGLKQTAKGLGSRAAGTTLALTELAKLAPGGEEADLRIAGADLLYPELVRKLGPKGVESLLNFGKYGAKIGRAMTPVGIAMILAGQGYDFYKQYQELKRLKEEDPEAYQKFIESRVSDPMSAEEISEIEDMGIGGAANGGLITRERFADGPKNPKRRNFLKILGGLASLPVLGKYFSLASKSGAVVDAIKTLPVPGKPEWFDSLVNKVITLGEDVSKKFATQDRQVVHRVILDKDGNVIDANQADKIRQEGNVYDVEDVTVTRNLDDGEIRVTYYSDKNMGAGDVDLVYKPGQADEYTKGTPPDTFEAIETEPRVVNMDGDIEYDGENLVQNIDDLYSDTNKLKQFATDQKPTMKEFIESKKKQEIVEEVNSSDVGATEYLSNKYGEPIYDLPDEDPPYPFASGGIANFFKKND